MTTKLGKFTDAYASMTVAVYQPLILRWVSGLGIAMTADTLAWRALHSAKLPRDAKMSTFERLAGGARSPRGPEIEFPDDAKSRKTTIGPAIDPTGGIIGQEYVRSIEIAGYPDAVAVGNAIYPRGILEVAGGQRTARPIIGITRLWTRGAPKGSPTVDAALLNPALARLLSESQRMQRPGDSKLGVQSVPVVLNGSITGLTEPYPFHEVRRDLARSINGAVDTWLQDAQNSSLATTIRDSLGGIYEFLPPLQIEEALSPIGMANFYRQLYFNVEEGVGPIEQAMTVAPLETLEVVYETVRRQIHEEVIEIGSEQVSEEAVETKNQEEVSDKVSSMIQRDASAAMSVNASGSIGVWQAGASASANMRTTTDRSREETTRRLKEVTTRASERITKTFSLRVRDTQETAVTNLTRRVIRNDSDDPVSYGLRRVLRRVLVKVQDLGPRLCWQLYISSPGEGLARSEFVHFRDAEIAIPEMPPGVPARPTGGTDTGTTSSAIGVDPGRRRYFVNLSITPGRDRVVRAVAIDSITDLEGGGKDDTAPSPINNEQWDAATDPATGAFSVKIAILPGDSASVSISYTFQYDPPQAVLDAWQAQVDAARSALQEQQLQEKFERDRALLTERSKIRPRPANDLRREERYEVMNRMISHLFARGDDPSMPSPLEIEYFHRYFDLEMMFSYTHPSWWKPRYAAARTGLGRHTYRITAESEPAPMGSSLGWLMQLDGDTRRNEFLNSPWVRVCLPIRAGREREAIAWLAKHVEGERGYDANAGPLAGLINDIQARRGHEDQLGINGPNYVAVDSPVGAPEGPLSPAQVYPVVDEFTVTLPTEGFVYDRLDVAI